MLSVGLISWVNVVVFLGADGSPLFKGNKAIFEDFLGVDLNETTITIVCDTTTVVTLGDQVLDGLPWDLALLVVNIGHISDSAHVVGDGVLANLVIRVIERVTNIPTEGLELLTFSEHSVEPGETEDSLSEFTISNALGEDLWLVTVETHHVSLDTTWGLLSNLEGTLE